MNERTRPRERPKPAGGGPPAGVLHRTLLVTPDRVALLGGEEPVEGAPPRSDPSRDPALDESLWLLRRARARSAAAGVPLRLRPLHLDAVRENPAAPPATAPERVELHRRLLEAGRQLERCFLPEPVVHALGEAVARATGTNHRLELALDLHPDFDGLPWETLQAPAGATGRREPLALHPDVQPFRRGRGRFTPEPLEIPPPLRVLVAVGSPESQSRDRSLLDYEGELEKILDAMEVARRKKRAYVRILHRGTVEEIRRALQVERFHVLYVSCHAEPGKLVLEDADGNEDRVDADRLWREALPAGRRPPLVVLAGCATGRPTTEEAPGTDPAGAENLPGLARELTSHGVPAVLAMQAPVSDPYATLLGHELFAYLADAGTPEPLVAVDQARRRIEERRRRSEDLATLAEWATPALYRTGPSFRLYDPKAPAELITEPPPPRLDPDVPIHGVGDFVGRRREERRVLRALRSDRTSGALVHGLGGVGKSTLAAQVLARLTDEGWVLASVSGEVTPEDLLDEVGPLLEDRLRDQGHPEDDRERRIVAEVKRTDLPWEERFRLLDDHLLGHHPLLLLVDNFEDNLEGGDEGFAVREPALEALLARWLRRPGTSRLLFTSRHPFVLPDQAHRHLEPLHLGPLSWPETRKLFYRLPGIDELDPWEQQYAYRVVGGHPRTLEYLDALLRGGDLPFSEIARRLKEALRERGVERPEEWLEDVGGDLDRSLAETVTLAADDVLLTELLKEVDKVPLARQLLIGASVYRLPVDEEGLLFQVGEIEEEIAEETGEGTREEPEG